MGVTERLIIQIEDADLDAVITKLANAKGAGAGGGVDDETRRLNELNKKINDTRKAARESGINLEQLPVLNRDMRLLANQMNIPGFREFSSAFFQTRRGVRAAQMGRESAGLQAAQLAPELAQQLSLQSMVGYAALILFIVNMIYDFYQQLVKQIEAERSNYEDLIRRSQDINHREYLSLREEQTGFATWADQFQANVESEGWVDAIVTLAVNRILSMAPAITAEERAQTELMINQGKYVQGTVNP